jgi:hypothetical protein
MSRRDRANPPPEQPTRRLRERNLAAEDVPPQARGIWPALNIRGIWPALNTQLAIIAALGVPVVGRVEEWDKPIASHDEP